MKKGLFILFLFTILFNLIFSTPQFTFERKLFVANGENVITSITSSEDDTYLFMKKDDNDYIELHKDKNNPKLFVFDLKDIGIYKFKYKKDGEEDEIELDEEIKVYESFDKLIKLTNQKDTTCYYIKDILSFKIENANNENIDLSNIKIYLYQPENVITNSNEVLIDFSKSSNVYTLNLSNKNVLPGNYKILISEGEFIENYLDQSIEFFLTDITPNSYFYISSKKLYLNTLCEMKNPEFKLKKDNNEIQINCNSNSNYDIKKRRYLCSFSNNIENKYEEYQIYYNIYKLNGNIKALKKISEFEFILYEPDEKTLKFNDLYLTSDFENKNIDKLIIYNNKNEKIEYLSSLKVDNPLKLLCEDNELKFKIFMTKGDEFTFSKVIRKLEDYEIDNPPSESEISYTFNSVKFTSPTFDTFTFSPNFVFVFPDFPYYYYGHYFNQYDYYYYHEDRNKFPYKYDIYSELEVTFDENNKKDIEYYKN